MNRIAPNIIQLLNSQEPDAIEQLYDQYGSALHGIVLRMLSCTDLAQKVIQDTFVKAWLNGAQYDESKGQIFTWLLKIARNTAIDEARSSQYRIDKKMLEINCLLQSPGGHELNQDTLGLKENVAYLEEKYKILVEMIYFNEYTFEEVSQKTGIPLGTVKTRMRYAMTALRKIYLS